MAGKGNYKVAAIIQARLSSTRLPGKVMMDLCGKTALGRVVERARAAKSVDEICVATTKLSKDDVIVSEAHKEGVKIYRGSKEDVLDRYCRAAAVMRADYIVRITADNPFTEPRFIDRCVKKIIQEGLDYVAMENVPYGSNAEVVSAEALIKAAKKAKQEEREHVTAYIYKNPELFRICRIQPPQGLRRPDIRITLDTMDDYVFLDMIFRHFRNKPTKDIRLESVIKFIDRMNA